MAQNVYYITNGKYRMTGRNQKGIGFAVLPGIIYSQLLVQKFFGGYTGGQKIMLEIILLAAYLVFSQVPYICIAIAAANMIMYTGMIWVLTDKIDMMWIRIILKVLSAAAIFFMEIGICFPVMEKKTRTGVQYVKTAGYVHR